MPPRTFSRHAKTFMYEDESGHQVLSTPDMYTFRELPDTQVHVATEGETIFNLAARYYASLTDPPEFSAAELWWVIADFQPQPIHDPTIALPPGQVLYIPSVRVVRDEILGT